MRTLILASAALLLIAPAARAEVQIPPGLKAYQRGDYAEAFDTWSRLAEAGDATSQYFLGGLYDEGKGVPQDAAIASQWYEKAAEGGYVFAQRDLAGRYYHGKGVPRDIGRAVHWYRRGAEQGNRTCQLWLGALYARGEGVPLDPNEAAKWYRAAAEQGDVEAMYRLGALYLEGALPDSAQAEPWLRAAAAAQGHRDATFALGQMYLSGRGVPQDQIQGLVWLALSSWRGHAEATESAHALLKRMSPEAVQEANRLLHTWRQDPSIFTLRGGYTSNFQKGFPNDGCKHRLNRIYRGLTDYAFDHWHQYPARLSELYPVYVDDLTVFTCPSDGQRGYPDLDIDSHGSYRYRPPPGPDASAELRQQLRDSTPGQEAFAGEPNHILIVWDKNHLPHQYGLFLDGHIVLLRPPAGDPPTAAP